MNEKTKRLARLSLLTALGAALLYLGSLLPGGRLALTAVAGFLTALVLMMYSAGWAAGVYAVTAALALLLLPNKGCAVYYAAFFGYYPLLKSFFERRLKKPLALAAKLLLYGAVFAVWWFVGVQLLLAAPPAYGWYLLLPAGAAAFLLYDVCMTILIRFYIQKISGYIQ